MTQSVFISLVGTQVLAVLNSLLSILKETKPELVVLIPTKATFDKANSLKAYLEENLKINTSVEICSSDSVADTQFPTAEEIVSRYKNKLLYFNLAGGMNFQIASCALRLDTDTTTFLYPESLGVHQIRLSAGKVQSHKNFPLPKVENILEILKMQGVKFRHISKEKSGFLNWALRQIKMNSQTDALENIEINGVFFEFVLNRGSELRFLKVIHKGKDDSRTSEDFLSEVDKVVDFALDRKRAYELYHRKIFVLTNIPTVKERIKTEGAGKIDVIDGQKDDEIKRGLREFFGLSGESSLLVSKKEEIFETEKAETSTSTLVTPLGENLLPTLIALWSHKPARAVLLYTPSDSEVLKIKNAMTSNLDLLPVASLSFIPVSITGHEILKIPKLEEGLTEVNISPGTKGQGAFLTLWAKLHGAEIYSIETKSETLVNLSTGTKKPLTAPNPIIYLKLTGKELLSTGKDREALLRSADFYEEILDRIRREGTILIKGDLFEELVAYVFAKLGADDVHVRVRTRWSEETEKFLIQKYGRTPHMTDVDVVVRFRTNYYVISCKAGKVPDLDDSTREVSAASRALFGRFTVPMLAHFLYPEREPTVKNGVWIFGYKTLIDEVSLKGLIDRAIKERRTTQQR